VLKRLFSLICVLLLLLLAGCNLPDIEDFIEPEPEPEPPVQQVLEPTPVAVGFVITQVIPDRGKPKGLELIEIRGGGFRDTSRVFFGGSEALDVTVTSEGRIFVMSPPHSPARVPVRVVNIDNTEAEAEKGFLYFTDIVIDQIVPPEGPATGGVPIELRGGGFVGTEAVYFDGQQALDVTVIDDETLLCILPGHPVGRATVHVASAGGVGRLVKGFNYFAPPRVSGFSPLAAPSTGGGTLALAGTGLVEGASVMVGGSPAEPLATTPDGRQIVVRIPPGEPGPADLSVTTQYGAVELDGAFTYLSPDGARALLNVWPSSGPASGGGEIMLVAQGLEEGLSVSVTIGGVQVPVEAVLPKQHTVLTTAPAGVPGEAVDITLTIAGSSSTLHGAYLYTPTLNITSITPSSGPVEGDTQVIIRGEGLSADMEVFIGALPATDLEFTNPTELRARTPLGSPGYADVRVQLGDLSATLADGFSYVAGETAVHIVVPDHGAIAGNTWVRIYGTDLPPYLDVRFDGVAAPYVERLSPSEVAVRTPRADEIGTIDVRVAAGPTLDQTVEQAFTYFDPTARWGGTWGEPIDGSLNVTVLAIGSDDPVDGAVVLIGNEDPPHYKGYTDDRGQVTLSGPHLAGRIDVTAAKFGSSASSIMDFDAENVTLFLSNPAPPSPGDGTPLEPGKAHGTVKGIGKYLVTPPWPCSDVDNAPPGHCEPCESDDDCGAAAPVCTHTASQPAFCSTTCDSEATPTGCAEDFRCILSADKTERCVPQPGELQARCYASSPSILSPLPVSDENNTLDLMEKLTFDLENLRLGEVAFYCLAGGFRVFADDTENGRPSFRPVVMGVARHVFVQPGVDPITELENAPTEIEIELNIPLSRAVNVVVGEQPLRPSNGGPHATTVNAHLDLGSDGFIPLASTALEPDAQDLLFEGLPQSLVDDLYDATYVFHAAARSDTTDTLPSSEVLRAKLGQLDDGSYLHHNGADWQEEDSGYGGDVLGLWAHGADSVFATTRQGTVIHYDGTYWSAQPVASGPPLNAVVSDNAGGAIVVGDGGRIMRWNGVGWTTDDSGTLHDLRGVNAFGPSGAVAVGAYVILEWDGNVWTETPFGPPKDLHAVWGPGAGDTWAVGADGIVLRRTASDGHWSAIGAPVYDDLYGLWGTSEGFVMAVGGGGRAIMSAGDGVFEVAQTPVQRTLRAVWGRSASDIYAVGDAATIVHFDGTAWSLVTEETLSTSLRALGGDPAGAELFAMGTHAVDLSPFLKIPTFANPAPNQAWNKTAISWSVKPGGGVASFNNLRLYGPSGALAWAIMAPGHLTDMTLPDLGKIEGLPLFPVGQKRVFLYRVQHPDFDIDGFDSRVFRLMDWRAWVIDSYTFDAADTSVPVDTVPGK